MAEKKNFDSDFCGSLPLHHINSIQDYGYLLVLDIKSLVFLQVSENVSGLLQRKLQEIIGSPLSEYMEQDDVIKIRDLVDKGIKNRVPLSLSFLESFIKDNFNALLHIKSDYLIIELEKAGGDGNSSFSDVYQKLKYISATIDLADTVQQVCDIAIRELRQVSGFDGVLMYRFDEDWNGTVIAENKDDRLTAYFGQTFPASDVPKQARQLYLKNPYRLIPDRNYQPVRLYPVINPITNAFIDLSDCNLRGVAAVHLEYMKNMGIEASMSIRVIYNDTLWGLISCHHIGAKYIDFEVCSIFEWLSDVISNKISLLINKERYHIAQELQQKRVALTDQVYSDGDLATGLLNHHDTNIMSLFGATGAVLVLNGKTESTGHVPGKDELENLMLWLEGKNLNEVFSTDYIAGLYAEAEEYADRVSGLIFIPINTNKADFVVCFRPELIEDISWGGNPNMAINFEKDSKVYHPRNSFELWKQTVSQHSLPWTSHELEVAESLRNFLFEFRAKQLLQ